MEKRFISRNNGFLIDLAFAYCMGKNYLWKMFFGWRLTNQEGCEFILPKSGWKQLEKYIKDNY